MMILDVSFIVFQRAPKNEHFMENEHPNNDILTLIVTIQKLRCSHVYYIKAGLYVIVTDRGLGFQVSYGPGPCSRKTERAKRAWSSCCTDQVRN